MDFLTSNVSPTTSASDARGKSKTCGPCPPEIISEYGEQTREALHHRRVPVSPNTVMGLHPFAISHFDHDRGDTWWDLRGSGGAERGPAGIARSPELRGRSPAALQPRQQEAGLPPAPLGEAQGRANPLLFPPRECHGSYQILN